MINGHNVLTFLNLLRYAVLFPLWIFSDRPRLWKDTLEKTSNHLWQNSDHCQAVAIFSIDILGRPRCQGKEVSALKKTTICFYRKEKKQNEEDMNIGEGICFYCSLHFTWQ